MPRVDHRKLESLFSGSNGAASFFKGGQDGGGSAQRRNLKIALGLQTMFAVFTLVFAIYETSSGNLVHQRPPAELFKVLAYGFSCLSVYRSIAMYLRLMVIWTITTAFSGVYQSLSWLENNNGSHTERDLVKVLLVLSVAGMVGNIIGLVTMFSWGGSRRRSGRRRVYRASPKEN